MNYELGLSNADIFDRCFYFMVRVRRVYDNQIHGQVFLGVTSTTFKIGYNVGKSPSVLFLYNLVERLHMILLRFSIIEKIRQIYFTIK